MSFILNDNLINQSNSTRSKKKGVMVTENKQKKIIKEISEMAIELMSEWPSSRNRQKQFILNYIDNGFANATNAAVRAGYKENSARGTASSMLAGANKFEHIPPVVKKIREEYGKRAAELSIATGVEILQFHTRVLRKEEKDVALVGKGEGYQEIEEVPASLKERQASANSLASYLGLNNANNDLIRERMSLENKKLRSETEQTEDAETLASDRMSKLEEVLGEIAEEPNKDSE